MHFLCKLFDQLPDLTWWEKQPFAPGVDKGPSAGDNRDAHEREVAQETPGEPESSGPYRRLADAILGFQVFPSRLADGVLRRRPVEIGDTVGLCYHLVGGLDLFFAARVIGRFDETVDGIQRTGFTYRTLAGHPELGEETFSVEKDLTTGRIVVALRSWSRPQVLLARLFSRVIRRLQLHAGRAALDHLATIAKDSLETAATQIGVGS